MNMARRDTFRRQMKELLLVHGPQTARDLMMRLNERYRNTPTQHGMDNILAKSPDFIVVGTITVNPIPRPPGGYKNGVPGVYYKVNVWGVRPSEKEEE
jgi:hypothetical protein